MKIVGNISLDSLTRDLSGALWIFARLREDGSAATSIHRCIQREVWREVKLGNRVVELDGAVVTHLRTCRAGTVCTTINGRAIKKQTGKGTFRQICEQVELTGRQGCLPPWYYIFELHDDDKKLHAERDLNRFETEAGLYRFLRDNNGGLPVPAERSTDWIKDKAPLKNRCLEHGVVTVPVLLNVAQEEISAVDWALPGLPECDLCPLLAHRLVPFLTEAAARHLVAAGAALIGIDSLNVDSLGGPAATRSHGDPRCGHPAGRAPHRPRWAPARWLPFLRRPSADPRDGDLPGPGLRAHRRLIAGPSDPSVVVLGCDHGDHRRGTGRGRLWPVGLVLVLPLLGLAVLLVQPELDMAWEHHPAHFWIVLVAAAVNVGARVRDEHRGRPLPRCAPHPDLARVPLDRRVPGAARAGDAGRPPGQPEHRVRDRDARRADHRVGVRGRVGDAPGGPAGDGRPPRADGLLLGGLIVLMVVWAVFSIARLPPLDGPPPPREGGGVLDILSIVASALFAFAAVQLVRFFRYRGETILLAMAAAFVLLAEALIAILVSRNWHSAGGSGTSCCWPRS